MLPSKRQATRLAWAIWLCESSLIYQLASSARVRWLSRDFLKDGETSQLLLDTLLRLLDITIT